MATKLKLGTDNNWATKKGNLLAYNDENGNFKPIPFDVTRASTATRLNKAGLIETVEQDRPRVEFDNNDKYLLLEPTRTNSLTYSEDFSQWTAINSTVLTNQVIAPDGSNNADKLTKYDAYGLISKFGVPISNSTVYSFSVFAKSDTGENITIRQASGSYDVRFYYNLSTQETASTGGGNDLGFIESKIEDFGNGWYRCTLICTSNSTTGDFGFYAGKDGTTSFDGSVFIFGAQLEAGTYATSYIPTTTAAVTRTQDRCTGGGDDNLFNDSEGVLFAELEALAEGTTTRKICLTNGSTNFVNFNFNATSGRVTFEFGSTSNSFYILNSNGHTLTNKNKIAIKYKSGDTDCYINGTRVTGNNGTFTLSGLDRINFENRGTSGSQAMFAKIYQLMYFNTALTDQELIQLTS